LASSYLKIEAKHALDTVHESWKVLWGFPCRRSVPPDATIANSVGIRIGNDSGYRPENLGLKDNRLASTYAVQNVVAEPAIAASAA